MLIFDFDGVLMDSVGEVALTTYNAATGNLCASLAELPPGVEPLFRRNRYHVQQIGDAISLMDWCLRSPSAAADSLLTPAAYQALVAQSDGALTDRSNRVFATRQRLIDRDPDGWLALHRPFQPLWRELIGRRRDPIVMLTNKNRDATLRLCRHFGLPVAGADLYSGDDGVSKIENMHRIQARFGRDRYFFVDDSVKNLKELDTAFNTGSKRISLILAAWGYTGPADGRTAAESGYPVFTQADLIGLLGQPSQEGEQLDPRTRG